HCLTSPCVPLAVLIQLKWRLATKSTQPQLIHIFPRRSCNHTNTATAYLSANHHCIHSLSITMVQSCCWKCGATPTPTPSVPDLPPPFSASSLDLTSLMSRNDAPLDAEIRVVVSDDQDQVDALDTQIHNLQATLAQLVWRRADAIERVRQHRATLYAIRRVPPELICEIFALTLSDDERDRATNPPWHLGHICRSWRYWALGYPHLWSSISIPFSKLIPGVDDVSSAEHSLQIIETQLVRSANGPLDVYWLAANRNAPDPAAVDVVLAHCRRWRALSLNISSRDDLEWLRPATGRLVALEKLEVIGSGSGTTVPDFFLVAPRLRQVSLANCRLVGSSPNIMLPWDQITHYRGIYSERTQLDILQLAPNMVKCAVSFTYPRDMSALDESCVILPHLRRLDIELPRFLIRINAPLLEELFCDSSWTMDVIALHHFVRRSGSACSL
ncbi:hypothetical protein B0H13DRAFT_2484226, partial [Mycena leptocephala]